MGIFQHDPHTDDSLSPDAAAIIDAFNGTARELLDQDRIVQREMQQTYGKASQFESFFVTLPAGQSEPILLAGYDLSRMRMLVTSTLTGVVIGHRSSVAINQGYVLVQNSSLEVKAFQDIYMKNPDPANAAIVSVWIEKSAI